MSVDSNWGDPLNKLSPCFNYFPIIYHQGDLSISGNGYGQGILLVEGNLTVQGRIDFYGPVIVHWRRRHPRYRVGRRQVLRRRHRSGRDPGRQQAQR